jgi:hypothetical protein
MGLVHLLIGVTTVLAFVGVVSLQQARYFDGDANAHARHLFWVLQHTPKHPFALKAHRRGLRCLGLSALTLAAGLLLHGTGWSW